MVLAATFILAPGAGWAQPPRDAQPPVTVAITLIGEQRNERLQGEIATFDEATLTLDIRGHRRVLRWNEITPASAFTARHRLVDESDAGAWLELARFGRALGVERQAEGAIRRALQLDASRAAEAEEIRRLPLGSLRPVEPPSEAQPPEAQGPVEVTDAPVDEAMHRGHGHPPQHPPQRGGRGTRGGEGVGVGGGGTPTFYQPVSQAQHRAALEQSRQFADDAGRRISVHFREIQTPHFIIFTDWDPVDDPWLADQLEMAYALVAREFNVPATDNVFIGKLPVYMYDSQTTMMRHAREIDEFPSITDTVAGYYRGYSDGSGRLVMSKPRRTADLGPDVARQMWARTLTHEFAHAFVARFRSNAFIPRWLNEGIAEVIAEQVYPRPDAMEQARDVARRGTPIAFLFDDENMPGGNMYPVMMTLVDGLYRQSPERFREYFDAIKRGEDAEAALLRLYGMNYAGLEAAWRAHLARR